jgi:Salmonella virulence plasmid 65kDa B protein
MKKISIIFFIISLLNNSYSQTDNDKISTQNQTLGLRGPIVGGGGGVITLIDTTPPPFTLTGTGASNQIGSSQGQLSVSLTGGANYNFPILLPPGINGVIPQISLNYSSQGGIGLAGYGWNVSGFSSITKIASSTIHDGFIDPVDFDTSDRFAFDGQRLLLKDPNQTYGASGTVYETENFSNVKITALGGVGQPVGLNYGPAYFIVEYPDGSTAMYGSTSVLGSAFRNNITYVINYWQNPQGVRINYFYTNENNFIYLNKITFGSTVGNTDINEINFTYKTRNKQEDSSIGNNQYIDKYILSEIHIKGNGVPFRNYYLTHDLACGYERLTSITEKTGDDSLFANPTVFGYDEDSISMGLTPNNANIDFVAYSANNLDPKLAYGCVGDFNGDGRKDVLNSTISNSNLNIITMEDKISLDNNDNDFIVTNITSQILPVYERISKTLAVSILEGGITSGFKKMQKDAWCDISKLDNGTGDNKKHILFKPK